MQQISIKETNMYSPEKLCEFAQTILGMQVKTARQNFELVNKYTNNAFDPATETVSMVIDSYESFWTNAIKSCKI